MLDVDHGTYPFVTSSNPIAGGVCTGAGIGPTRIDRVIGVIKAYTTRVGSGPFPTELFDDDGEKLWKRRRRGRRLHRSRPPLRLVRRRHRPLRHPGQRAHRPLPHQARRALGAWERIPVCVAYEIDGVRHDEMPMTQTEFHHATPIYEYLDGWWEDISGCRTFDELPANAQAYVRRARGACPGARIWGVGVAVARPPVRAEHRPPDRPGRARRTGARARVLVTSVIGAGCASTRWPWRCPATPASPRCTRPPATRASARVRHPARRRPDGRCRGRRRSPSGSASTWSSSARRRRWSPAWPTPSAPAGIACFGPSRGGRAARGLQGVRQGGDGRGRGADRAARVPAPRRARSPPRSTRSARRTSSRTTASPPARASWSPTTATRRSPTRPRCERVVIEEFLDGPEVSLFAVTDGTHRAARCSRPRTSSAIFDGDAGPNTGGMGAYTPLPWAPAGLVDEVLSDGPAARPSTRWRGGARRSPGLLYAGLALTARGTAGGRVQRPLRRPGDPAAAGPAATPRSARCCTPRPHGPARRGRPARLVATARRSPSWSPPPATPSAPRPATCITRARPRPTASTGVDVIHAGTAVTGGRPRRHRRRPGARGRRRRRRRRRRPRQGLRRRRPHPLRRRPAPHRHRRRAARRGASPAPSTDADAEEPSGPMTVPNVLATRYAGADLAAIWSPEHKIVLERRLWIAVLQAQRDLGVDVPDGVVEAYETVVDQVDLDSIARPRAGHPARREGAHRGVLRAGRPRAHPQGHDLARPHRERRAAADPLARSRWSATAPSPRWPGWRGWRPSTRRLVMAGRSHNVAAQATTLGKRFATVGRRAAGRVRAARRAVARYPLRGIKGPVGTAQDSSTCSAATPDRLAELEQRVAAHLGFERVLTSVGQVYPRSLDFDVGLGAGAARRPARRTWPPRSG